MNWLYFLTATLIWGSTFLAIKFQLGSVAPTLSVVYRFALASAICLIIAWVKKSSLKFSVKDHFFIFLQGLFLFCINYVLTYQSERYLTSGIVALGFTTVIYFNTFGVWYFFKQKIKLKSLAGSTIGALGLGLIFYNEIRNGISSTEVTKGLVIIFFAGVASSCGNLFTVRNHRNHLPFFANVALAMTYGTICSAVYAGLCDDKWTWDPDPHYWVSLIFLAVFGSVIAFLAYLSLIKRVGAERAAYVNIMSPVLALILSTIFEHFAWSPTAVSGVVFCLIGNYLVLGPDRSAQIQQMVESKI